MATQNIYDDPDFFEGYSRLERSRDGLSAAPEWPSLQALLPDLGGRRIVDLGCGYGWFCRWAREHGAERVLGLDVSERMLARAAAMTSDPGITYRRADLERLDLGTETFDFAYSSLALHYIDNLSGLLAEVHLARSFRAQSSCSRSSTRSSRRRCRRAGPSVRMVARHGRSTAIRRKAHAGPTGWPRA
jgi:SAM-dependent methyltransferase